MYFNDCCFTLSIQRDWPVWMKEKETETIIITHSHLWILIFQKSNAILKCSMLIHWIQYSLFITYGFYLFRWENGTFSVFFSLSMFTLSTSIWKSWEKNAGDNEYGDTHIPLGVFKEPLTFSNHSDMRQLKPHTVCFFSNDLTWFTFS